MHAHQNVVANGPALQLYQQQANDYWFIVMSLFFSTPMLIAPMAFGFACGRWRVLEKPFSSKSQKFSHAAIKWGLMIGLPSSLLSALGAAQLSIFESSHLYLVASLLPQVGFVMSLAYIGLAMRLIAQWQRHQSQPQWAIAIAAMGQRSLTNYLSQSLIMLICLSYFGLRLGDDLRIGGLTLLAISAYIVQLYINYWMHLNRRQGFAEIAFKRVMRGFVTPQPNRMK